MTYEPDCVYRWRLGLAKRVGLCEPEIAERVAQLEQYCAAHGITPDRLLKSWEERGDLTVRRRPGATEAPNLAVESFLIHNGVNIFGDIVCVAGRRLEDLAAQGPQFVPRR
ncbi:MAG: hypothetical protein ACRDZO_10435 [Egibacteraceae bacterium]